MPYFRVTPVAASEGAGTLDFVITLDEASTNEVRVTYNFDQGTAVYSGSGQDFVTQSGTLVFSPGQVSRTLTVTLTNNTTAEPTEAFWLDLNAPVNATVQQRWTPAYIFDNDATAGTPAIAVNSVVVDEMARTASFFVSLSRPSTGIVSVAFTTGDDTATAGSDYRAANGTLTFNPGEMVKTVVVEILNDTVAEGPEFFRLGLANPVGATLVGNPGIAEIAHSDAPAVGAPMVTARMLAVGEGDTVFNWVVQLSAPSTNEVRVNYGTDQGTAVYSGSGQDFQTYSGTLVFAPGETTRLLPVLLVDNTTAESTEVMWLDLNSPVNATVPQRWTAGFIFDNDATAGTPAIAVNDVVVDETARTASFFVSLSRPSTGTVSVAYTTGDDTAIAGSDYRAASGTLFFAPGEVVKTVVVDILDDAAPEGAEYFRFGLANPSGATLVRSAAVAEIAHNDAPAVGAPMVTARPVAAGESDTAFAWVIQLSAPSTNEVRVNFGSDQGSAVYSGSGQDFQSYSGTLVFAPGETTKTVPVVLVDNTAAESTEVLWLDLNTPVNATVPQRWNAGLIFDNDATAGTPAIAVSDPVVDESARTASFFVSLSRPSVGTVSVGYLTSDDTAVAGSDYRQASGTLVFAPGEVVKTVVVDILDDGIAEGQEFFRLGLSNPVGATLVRSAGVAEIAHNDAPAVGAPMVTARPVAAGEGDTAFAWVIQLSAPSSNEVRVNFGSDQGSAVYSGSGQDFQSYSGTLVFAPGETTKTVPVVLVDNTTAESTEVLWLDLNTPVNATVPQRWNPGLIFDNDATAGTPAIAVRDVVVDEGARTASFFVSLSRPSTGTVTVGYSTADDTATAGADYRAVSGTLAFAPGEVVKTVVVDLFDDALAEPSEFFRLALANPSGATLVRSGGTAEIGPSDAAPAGAPMISARPAAAGEGDSIFAFVVQLSAPSTNEVRVSFGVDQGTAVYSGSGQDFQSYSGTLVFAPGETTKTVPVVLVDNTTAEGIEGLWLDLNTPVNAVVGRRWTPGYIVDNDATAGTPAVSVGDVVVDESAGTASFFVSLSRPSTVNVSVAYTTADDTALAGSDYRAAAGTLVFAPGETVKTVVVDILDDNLAEADEAFELRLSNPSASTLGDPVGGALIGANDGHRVSQPQITARPVVVSEGDTGTGFVVQLSAAGRNEVRVNFSLANGTAVSSGSGQDFQSYSGTLVFAPGETTKWLPFNLVDNTTAEGNDETFSLDLNTPVNATVPQRLTNATIIDNDGSGTVYSFGRGNDSYTLASVLDRVVESPGGGIDTIRASFSTTLPDQVENLVLTGGATAGTGNALNNVFRGTAGNNTFDGREGIDTVVFGGPRASYITAGNTLSRTVSSPGEGTDTLLNVERVQFSDALVAEDTLPGGNTYLAYALLNAVLDSAPPTSLLSQWTAQMDRWGSLRATAQELLNTYAPGIPDELLVAYIWGTIIETPIPTDMLVALTTLIADGTFTQASLLELVTTMDLNTVEIAGIVGQPLVLDPSFFPVPAVLVSGG